MVTLTKYELERCLSLLDREIEYCREMLESPAPGAPKRLIAIRKEQDEEIRTKLLTARNFGHKRIRLEL